MIIDGKEISSSLKDEIKAEVAQLVKDGKRVPTLAVILVGDNQASVTYVRNKERGCAYTGIRSIKINLPETTSQEELLGKIDDLNRDPEVDGILVQLPLPKSISSEAVLEAIDPNKDVDGFHPSNVAKLFLGEKGLLPCTPHGIMVMLDHIHYDLRGKEVVVLGRSNIVGKPVALLALQRNATVTICHSKTENVKEVCKRADILIAAVGKAKMVDASYIKEGAVIIDVGINRDENGKLCGDVDFASCKDKASYITPVPGGVGPMTIALLLHNTLEAYKNKEGE